MPSEKVKALEVERVGEEILFVQVNQDSRMTNENGSVLSFGESKGAARKIASPPFYT